MTWFKMSSENCSWSSDKPAAHARRSHTKTSERSIICTGQTAEAGLTRRKWCQNGATRARIRPLAKSSSCMGSDKADYTSSTATRMPQRKSACGFKTIRWCEARVRVKFWMEFEGGLTVVLQLARNDVVDGDVQLLFVGVAADVDHLPRTRTSPRRSNDCYANNANVRMTFRQS